MWTTIAGGLISLAGTVASGIGSAVANKKRIAEINKNKAEDNLWYMKEYYQDPTQRGDNAAILSQLSENMKEAQKTNAAKAKITGMTQEAQLAQQDSLNKGYGDTIRSMASRAAKQRDLVGEQWRRNQRGYNDELSKVRADQAQAWGNLATNAMNLASSALTSYNGRSGRGSKVGSSKVKTPIAKQFGEEATKRQKVAFDKIKKNPFEPKYTGVEKDVHDALNPKQLNKVDLPHPYYPYGNGNY